MAECILHIAQDLSFSGSLGKLLVEFLSQLSLHLENDSFMAV